MEAYNPFGLKTVEPEYEATVTLEGPRITIKPHRALPREIDKNLLSINHLDGWYSKYNYGSYYITAPSTFTSREIELSLEQITQRLEQSGLKVLSLDHTDKRYN